MDLLERAKQMRAVVQMYAAGLDDTQAVTVPTMYPTWAAGIDYAAQAIIQYDGRLYRVEQAHTSQAHRPHGRAGVRSIYAGRRQRVAAARSPVGLAIVSAG